MRSAVPILCVASVMVLLAPPARGDDVEALFGSNASNDDGLSTFIGARATEDGGSGTDPGFRHASSDAQPDHWAASSDATPLHAEPVERAHGQSEHEQASGLPINVVPEPSAVILALAALVYFLLFGRRRVA